MKKSSLLWMGVVLMIVIGMSSQAMAQTDYYYYTYTVGTVPIVYSKSIYIFV